MLARAGLWATVLHLGCTIFMIYIPSRDLIVISKR